MQALLLATGETQKLKPVTERIPSPLIPVLNRPVMVYNLELLGRLGFKRILVSVHTLAGGIEKYFGDGQKWGLSLEYVLQRDALGSAGALRWAKRLLQEAFLVMPADIIADVEVDLAIQHHTARQALATVAVQPGSLSSNRKLLEGNGGWIRGISGELPGTQTLTDLGIYIFDPSILDHIPPNLPFDIHLHLLPKLLALGIPVHACLLSGYWNPLETFQDYVNAQHVFLSKALKERFTFEEKLAYRYNSLESRQIARGVLAGRNVRVHPDTRILPPVCIGQNSWLGREVELGPDAIVGSNVLIDRSATVRNSIIFDNTYIGKLVNLENRLVNQDQLIDLSTNENIQVDDAILLSKAGPHFAAAGLKRLLDILLAILFLLISLPVTLTLGVLVLLSTGQVFSRVPCQSSHYRRRKINSGTQGTFYLLHFNTRKKESHLTELGKWLESWEGQRLPELWNVLKGDLALIGLKPVTNATESRIRAAWQLEQASAMPGFTGLWYIQASDINPLEETLIADAYYLATSNWKQDLRILWRTPFVWYRKARDKRSGVTFQAIVGASHEREDAVGG